MISAKMPAGTASFPIPRTGFPRMKKRATVAGLAGALVLVSAASPAMAANARTWISGKGVDQAGCGPIASPCRTIQYAHDNTNAGGEIDVLDSAGYGAVTITKSISVVGNGAIAGLLAPAGQNAVTVNAGANDTIVLRGLTIEGNGVGLNGIGLYAGGYLDIADCVVQNFAAGSGGGNGILVFTSTGGQNIHVVNTTVSHNAGAGLYLFGSASSPSKTQLVVDHVIASANAIGGIVLNASLSQNYTLAANVSDSMLSFNTGNGLEIRGYVSTSVDATRAESNTGNGFDIEIGPVPQSASLTIGRSVSASNGGVGLSNASSGGALLSFGDNQLVGNSAPTAGTIGTATPR